MASQLSSWYTGQYSNWNRTRRLHQTPYLARPETNTSRQARTMAQATTVAAINGLGSGGPPPKDSSKEKKGPETLFGPNIGVISGGPAWTNATEKKVLKDELTMDVVKSWIEKSKEPTQPTTTLQALVNLKRPTIRLSPLETLEGDESHHGSQHALEFEYDCDAPKCGIYVHVLLPPGHPDAAPTPLASDGASPKLSKFLVFESVVDGGYGNILKLEEGAILELGRFETTHEDAGKSSSDMNSASVPATSGASVPTAGAEAPSSAHPNSRRKRLTHLFTKRHNNRNMSVSGPALAVVDASSPDNSHPTEVDKLKKGDADDGIKVTIRIAALDEQGTELASPNEQVTYLSVERFGPKASPAPEVKPEDEEDTRPWVVKVVKREATIGAHTFHLHEIYGLTASSSSTHTHAPTAPLPSTHTYPPVAGAPVVEPNDTNDDSPSECLLCLSSPREVVLLPCRHLVACKDCALNMVEFGAGGNITQPADEPPATADGAAEGGEASASGTGGGEATTPAPLPTRRKRKAKGWFCPVCRQPYTSLLRITTTPPNTNETKNEAPSPDPRPEESDDDHDEGVDQDIADASPSGLPLPVTAEAPTSAQPQTTQTTADVTSGGLFTRPGFLRGLTGRGNGSRSDLESQL
ncbi:hypothetical protein BDP27DRAFT_1391127 [Rhodocollybia butyracea]|uniref:RING-type domain-containing protein n=1 Tax=Rhodocollybia butyracea TaxID=206335 RepID=A0A9P5Q3W6_9AGAR|nr:hypothetical protein BDP27DRAFT_1391127 [Rhodocollybia butyracea]